MLSIIIVNYRSAPLIADSLASVERHNPGLPFEIIVVDNASGDDSRAMLLERFPAIQWIDMGYNAGFARANNAGLRAARGHVCLLLNPDTLALDDSITRCYNQLLQGPWVAAGVQQLHADGTPQISGNFFVPWGLNHLLPLPYWGSLVRWAGYRARARVPNVREAAAVEEVDWISGAFLMVKQRAVQEAGAMDEDFFLYAEEVEWCHRLRRLGRLAIFGDLRIIHLEGGSINTSQNIRQKGYYNLFDRKGLQLMVSNHLRVRKQYGVPAFLFLLLNYSWAWLLFLLAGSLHRLLTLKNPFSHWGQAGAFGRNLLRLWALAPRMIAGRPYFYKMF